MGLLALTLSPRRVPRLGRPLHGAPGPIHAGNTFGWYQHGVFRQEFIGPKPGFWKKKGRGIVRTQNGMLTLMSTKRGSVSATLDLKGHTYGRWEIRMRARTWRRSRAASRSRSSPSWSPAAPATSTAAAATSASRTSRSAPTP